MSTPSRTPMPSCRTSRPRPASATTASSTSSACAPRTRRSTTQREAVTADGNTAAAIATLQMWRCVIFAGLPDHALDQVDRDRGGQDRRGPQGIEARQAARGRARGRRLHGRRRGGVPRPDLPDRHQLGGPRPHDRDHALAGRERASATS